MIDRMLVIVPTRGRPENLARLEQGRKDTLTSRADFLYIVDHDDPEAVNYAKLGLNRLIVIHERLRLGGTLNWAARKYAHAYDAIGFMGDDHLPRTENWDLRILQALDVGAGRDPRVVYGNDLLQGANLPTAVFMHSRIIRAMGFMNPPDQTHLYLDNFWKSLGTHLDGLRYLPDVVIEHIHPAAGKAEWDDRYAEVNSPAVDSADQDAFLKFMGDGRFAEAVIRVKAEYGQTVRAPEAEEIREEPNQ